MPGIAREIGVDVAFGFAGLDAQLAAQAERADAIDDAEIDRLGPAPHQTGHLRHRHTEHLAGRPAVNILAGGERLAERRHVRHMGQQAQFDLRVVRTHQYMARRRDEGLADAAALLRPDRDILQVGVVGRQPPGGGDAAMP